MHTQHVTNRVINHMCKLNIWLNVFTTQLTVFDQDMWLCYMRLKQRIFSLVFFRFLLMLTTYEKNHIFLVEFVWFGWLVSKYKNKLLFLFVNICIANFS